MLAAGGHTVCLLTDLQAAPHTFPSKGSWGLSLKAAGHQICSLLTPQDTKSHLSQPNKPRHWLTPFLEMGQPPWSSSVPSIQCPESLGTIFTWSLFFYYLFILLFIISIISFAPQSHSSLSRNTLQAQGGSSCQHISGCICHTPAALWVCRQTPFEQPRRPVLLQLKGKAVWGAQPSSMG